MESLGFNKKKQCHCIAIIAIKKKNVRMQNSTLGFHKQYYEFKKYYRLYENIKIQCKSLGFNKNNDVRLKY